MEKLLFILFPLILLSCSQNENSINISVQSEVMKYDSISIEYFEAIAVSAKTISEGSLNMMKFTDVMKLHNRDYCNIKEEVFEGNNEMINFAKIQCRVLKATQELHKKFPFISEMNKEDRIELFTPLVKRQEFDIEKIKTNFEKKNSAGK